MSLQDPIADMLTRIRNAYAVNRKTVQLPFSKLKLAISKILEQEGYILGYEEAEADNKKHIILNLKYYMEAPVITKIQRVSKSSLRVYRKKSQLPKVQDGLGIAIISTSKGLMSDRAARAEGHGGEVLCYVY